MVTFLSYVLQPSIEGLVLFDLFFSFGKFELKFLVLPLDEEKSVLKFLV